MSSPPPGDRKPLVSFRSPCGVRADLIRHSAIPPSASPTARINFLDRARLSIDGAMATLHEIRFYSRERGIRTGGIADGAWVSRPFTIPNYSINAFGLVVRAFGFQNPGGIR
jgi:hypothetical protein